MKKTLIPYLTVPTGPPRWHHQWTLDRKTVHPDLSWSWKKTQAIVDSPNQETWSHARGMCRRRGSNVSGSFYGDHPRGSLMKRDWPRGWHVEVLKILQSFIIRIWGVTLSSPWDHSSSNEILYLFLDKSHD